MYLFTVGYSRYSLWVSKGKRGMHRQAILNKFIMPLYIVPIT